MDHISEPYEGFFQVRIQRGNRIITDSFSSADYGGREGALIAARDRRQQLQDLHEPIYAVKGSYARKPLPGKLSHLPPGVSRFNWVDLSSRNRLVYLRYQASWRTPDGRHRVKCFQAGRVNVISKEDEIHAEKTAIAFRQHWEHCWDTGEQFTPELYRHWKESVLYPWSDSTPLSVLYRCFL